LPSSEVCGNPYASPGTAATAAQSVGLLTWRLNVGVIPRMGVVQSRARRTIEAMCWAWVSAPSDTHTGKSSPPMSLIANARSRSEGSVPTLDLAQATCGQAKTVALEAIQSVLANIQRSTMSRGVRYRHLSLGQNTEAPQRYSLGRANWIARVER